MCQLRFWLLFDQPASPSSTLLGESVPVPLGGCIFFNEAQVGSLEHLWGSHDVLSKGRNPTQNHLYDFVEIMRSQVFAVRKMLGSYIQKRYSCRKNFSCKNLQRILNLLTLSLCSNANTEYLQNQAQLPLQKYSTPEKAISTKVNLGITWLRDFA